MNEFSRRSTRWFLASLFLSQAVAAATNPASNCTSGRLCFWDTDKTDNHEVASSYFNWSAFGWNDRADYFRYNGNFNACLYEHANYKGRMHQLRRGEGMFSPPAWQDVVSSNQITSSRCRYY